MQSWLRSGGREWLLIICAVILFLIALLFPAAMALGESLTAEERFLAAAYEQGEIIRLHVLANSDSPYDQSVKLAVRDALIDAFGDLLLKSSALGCEEAYETLQLHTPDMLKVARLCAAEHGFEGEVRAEVGLLHLPEKKYGRIVLPEGQYRALRITLGSGNGKNWWCVLYPQLCLSLAQESEATEVFPHWNTADIFENWLLFNQ